ncbi:dihydrolipoyl dehydrogenase family protein [Tropicimonas sp. S265A]|uniref:dihydrolipoyl dehydrogenase family protein n=1 Tax=Tropicimonas sp. S265A TaxID=3415134 RepID=UPI003C79AB48
MHNHYDLAVIGGGSGGLAAAKRAAAHGALVVLFEPGELGGTCVNRGCVPKKLLWQVARHWTERAGLKPVADAAETSLDPEALMARIHDHIGGIRDSFAEDLEENGVAVVRHAATIDADRTISADGETYRATKTLIATGAKPKLPDIPGADLMCTSDDVFRWTTCPDTLVIVGGGYIGAEFASIFSALGTRVTIVQSGSRLLPGFDEAAVACVTETLTKRGVRIILDAKPHRVDAQGDRILLGFDDREDEGADRVVCAIGRAPNIGTLGPGAEDLDVADSGALRIDGEFETSRPGIFAIGDVADRLPLTPVATRDGETFADQHFGEGAEQIPLDLVATAAFTLPPVAQIGDLSRKARGEQTSALKNPVLAPDVEPESYHRLSFSEGKLVGAVIADNSAPEMIAPFAALIGAGAGSCDVERPTGIHPSFGEELIGR